MRRLAELLALSGPIAFGTACGFGSTGGSSGAHLGDDDGDDDGGGTVGSVGGGTGGDATSTAGNGSAAGSITDPTTAAGTTAGMDDGSSGAESTGSSAGDPCNPPPVEIHEIPVAMAVLGSGVETGTHSAHGLYASLDNAGESVSFPFNSMCGGTYFVHAFVYDEEFINIFDDNADSFGVKIDGMASTTWNYGCQSVPGPAWGWHQVQSTIACFDSQSSSWTVAPGPHTVHLAALENGTAGQGGDALGDVAAVTKIVVTNDPAQSP